MIWTDCALLFSKTFHALLNEKPIGLIDCGARDNLPEPWLAFDRSHSNLLTVLGFEADADEAQRLSQSGDGNRIYVPAAAWRDKGRQKLYLTDPPATSSMFPPNEDLRDFYGPGYRNIPNGRKLQRVVEVPTTTLDDVIGETGFDADFLKIDTQGAEYEILEGARHTLKNRLFGVVAETWTVEVYKGTRPTWDVMALMAQCGFIFMTHHVAGLAQRSFPDASTYGFSQRHQITSLEILFFREPDAFVKGAASPVEVYKAAAIADIYGFPDIGVALLRQAVMRWPGEITNVQNCYNELKKFRSLAIHPDRLYPTIRGAAPI